MYEDTDLKAFINRFVPEDERATWKSASKKQIADIIAIANRPLPDFYVWFLENMGAAFPHQQYGYKRQDLRIETVLKAYHNGLVQQDPRFLLIGRFPRPEIPQLLFYDLDTPCRNDAMVLSRPETTPTMNRDYETLCEKLTSDMFRKHRVACCKQQCEGSFTYEGTEIHLQLDSVMHRLGFMCPIETGSYCRLYEREDAAMVSKIVVEGNTGDFQCFYIGGSNVSSLRLILGDIATTTPIEVKIDQWIPEHAHDK